MTSFITGATGFIGQRLLVNLKSKGEKLKILSRKTHPEYDTVVCDLQFEIIPDNALYGVKTIFHLAGFAHDLGDTKKVEGIYRAVNVDATVKLAELAVVSGVKHFIFVSSVKAGVEPSEGVYSQTKREAELKILEIGEQSDMYVTVIRPSLVYGPSVKGNLALMQRGITQGWFPPLPKTGNCRSMIHVDDLVKALLLVAGDERANGEIFIVTDGESYSSREIYETICQVVGKQVPSWSVPRFLFNLVGMISPNMHHRVEKLLGDECYSSKKLEELGFKAEKTLKDMDYCEF